MLRVRDIMTRRVTTLRCDATIDSAAWSLSAAHVSGAPVRDAHGNLVGILSKSDLADMLRHFQVPETVRVSEAMTPAVWAVCPDDPAMRAVDLMLEKGIHRVVVVSRPGTIAGIVTATDVLRALSRGGSFRDDDPAVEKAAAPAGPSQ